MIELCKEWMGLGSKQNTAPDSGSSSKRTGEGY